MTDFQIELLGLCAAFLTTFGFLPQAIKIFKTKDTSGISLSMYVALITRDSPDCVQNRVAQNDCCLFLANAIDTDRYNRFATA